MVYQSDVPFTFQSETNNKKIFFNFLNSAQSNKCGHFRFIDFAATHDSQRLNLK